MREDMLEEIRKQIKTLNEQKEKSIKRKKYIDERIKELEKLYQIQEYLKLLKAKKNLDNNRSSNYALETEEEKIYNNYVNQIKQSDACNIYLFLNKEVYLCPMPNEIIYLQNLEQPTEITISEKRYAEFIEKNNIIYRSNSRDYGECYYDCAKIDFKRIQKEYFDYLINHSQEQAKKYILSKYKRKI